MKKNKRSQTIGEMCNSRQVWMMKPVTQVVKNKKGKGAYNRQATKRVAW